MGLNEEEDLIKLKHGRKKYSIQEPVMRRSEARQWPASRSKVQRAGIYPAGKESRGSEVRDEARDVNCSRPQ